MSNTNRLVCYTDGSSQPNPGFAGYGLFGYVLKNSKSPRAVNYPARNNFKFTYKGILSNSDAAKLKKPNNFECLGVVEHIGSIKDKLATNNQGEMLGLYMALKYAMELEDIGHVHVISDSKYALTSFTKYLPKWEKNDYKTSTGSTIKNLELWKMLGDMRDELKERKIKVTVEWVKGHNDDIGNTIADMYALIGTNYARNQYEEEGDIRSDTALSGFTPISEFRKEINSTHFSLDYKAAFFYTGEYNEDLYMLANTYSVGSKKLTSELIGHRDLNAAYALMYKGVPKVIKGLRNKFSRLPREFNVTSVIDLETLKKDKLISRLIGKIGFDSLVSRVKKGKWNHYAVFNRSGIVVSEADPSYTHLLETYNTYSVLEETIMKLDTLKRKEMLIDMTSFFYDEDGKCTLAYADKDVDLSDMLIDAGYDLTSKILITFGKDTPSYRIMSSIEGKDTKVYLYPDLIHNRNLITLVFIIEYKSECGEDAILAQTNVLGKYLTRGRKK